MKTKNKIHRTAGKHKITGRSTPAISKKRITRQGKLLSQEVYELMMKEIDALMKVGEDDLSQAQLKRLESLSKTAEAYEDLNNPLPAPSSLPEIVRLRLFQMHINQSFAAKLLGVSDTKFSQIMNGKQKPDIQFVKAVHNKLKVDANTILKAL